jgi:hypothetical protein
MSKDRNAFVVGLEDKGITMLRNVGNQSTQRNIPEDLNLQQHRCENLKSPNLEVNKIRPQICVNINSSFKVGFAFQMR